MKQNSWKDRLRYFFDKVLSKGPAAMMYLLAVATALLILGISGFVYLAGIDPEPHGFGQIFWISLLRTLDPGTMGGDTGSWPFLLSMLAVTLGGIGTVSTLIAIINTSITEKLNIMRKGRSRVIETGHIVILGWTEQVFTVISELVEANRNQPKSCIVILADKGKVDMEDEIRDKIKDTGHTRIVCRTGDPTIIKNLEIASIDTARAIMILSPDGMANPDAAVIKTMLAITKNPNRSRDKYYNIVAEIRDTRNRRIAQIAGGKEETLLVLVDNIVSRIMAQTCSQPGLSRVYQELLSFSGDEIYFKSEPSLEGKSFGDALFAYDDSSVIGIKPKDGTLKINPSMETKIGPGDHLIFIAEDDNTINLSNLPTWDIRSEAIQSNQPAARELQNIIMLGWNHRAPLIIEQLGYYLAPGSQLLVIANIPEADSKILHYNNGLSKLACNFTLGDVTDREFLDSLEIENFQHVILLPYSDIMDMQKADTLAIMTLIHLRDIADHSNNSFSIVSELLDVLDRNLAETTRADDFVVSNSVISMIMAQVVENKDLHTVFTDLFDSKGSEIYLKPAENYVKLDGKPVNMYTVIEAGRRHSEVAIGYRLHTEIHDATKNHGVYLNKEKSDPVTFSEGDQVIVLAEE